MVFKKCILMLSLVVVAVLSIPSFASAEVIQKTDSYTKWYIKGYSHETTFKGREEGTSYLYSNEVIADLGAEYSVKYVDYYAQGGVDGGYIAFYDVNFRRVTGFDLKLYGYKGKVNVGEKARYVSVGHSTRQSPNSLKVSTLNVYIDDGAVSNVSNLKATPEVNKVTLNWKNPEGEENFKGLRIYQDNKMIATLDNQTSSYIVKNLDANKSYTFTVKSLDQNGVETKGVSVKTITLMTLIDPPKNVFLTPQNGSLIINWESVNSGFLKGYNVYVDGKKVNDELLVSNKLILKNLENDKKYSVQISVVNLADKEGNKSEAVIESPSKNATTIEYDLKSPLTAMELLETAGTIVMWLSPFILVGIAVVWFKPLKKLIVQAVLDHKKKGEKK
ncbi:fibronectin type III domain-containing protein [Bacillus thuringiensis]|uniref:fibronectin type III domain-containing protein n=1 Tax=Bacillus thuringiensis TaxID=1428 RepID=UPI00111DA70D|nr:fibronectin type III domain-containing protein [Bacillus thuringiensis]MED3068687.1 fibronectin type III domain-containing protein [Bacillus thuringiensis]